MTDKKKLSLSRRKLLGGLGAIGLAGAGAGFGTSALFNDEETFENNSITAGTLDMTVSADIVAVNTEYDDAVGGISYSETADGAAVTGLTLGDFKPGDWVIVCYEITIEDNPGYVLVQANNLISDENGFEEPEPEDGDSDGEGELDDKLLTTVWDNYDDTIGDRSGLSTLDIVTNNAASSHPDSASTGHSWDSSRSEGGVVNNGIHYTTLQETYDDWFDDGFLLGPGPDTDASKIGGPANDQESKTVYLLLEVPVEVGNEIQGDSVSFDLEWRAQQVRNNDSPFPGPVINADTGDDFPSIQAAIDDSDTDDGDTIRVREGASFDEDVNIGVKNLTLEAISNTKPTIEGQVVVTADGVTVDGFTVSPPPATSNKTGEAIRVDNSADDVVITNNTVTEFNGDGLPTWEGLDGIVAFGGDASDAIENITISNNAVEKLNGRDTKGGAAGISIQGNVDGATVENNVVSEIGQESTAWAFGVTVRGTGNHNVVPRNVDVVNNDVSDVLASQGTDTLGVGLGLEMVAGGMGYTFKNNIITDVNIGVEIKQAADELTLSGNDISAVTTDSYSSNSYDPLYLAAKSGAGAGSHIQTFINNNTYDVTATSGGSYPGYQDTIVPQ